MTRARRWVVTGARTLLAQALTEHSSSDPAALGDGRVFVNGRRAHSEGMNLTTGDVVEIAAPRCTSRKRVRVISDCDGIVAVEKPAGIPTEPDRRGRVGCLVEVAAEELGVPVESLHATSRLDLGVSGVVLLAATRAARQQVAAWRRQGALRRRYLGLAQGALANPEGSWKGASPRDPRPAETHYLVAATNGSAHATITLLALQPLTGRMHQLRAHCAAAGAPLLGDRAYGGQRRLAAEDGAVLDLHRVALHAASVEVRDGVARGPQWESPPPAELVDWWKRLGGAAQAWSAAMEATLP